MATAADTVTANKQLAVRWLELISAGAVDELCAITPADWTMEGGPPDLPRGPAGIRALFATFGQITQTGQVHDVIAEGDRVAVRATNRCVQDRFMGVPAAGIEQVFTATFVFQILDGQVHRISGATPRTCSVCSSSARASSHPAKAELTATPRTPAHQVRPP